MNFFLNKLFEFVSRKNSLAIYKKIDLIFIKCYYVIVYFYNKNGG